MTDEPDSVLHGPRGSTEELGKTPRRCPECLGPVDTSADWRKMFCCEKHRQAFHNRQLIRGRKLVVLVMAARITRGGHRRRPAAGATARSRAERLMDTWWREDRAEGRMGMDEYFETRERLGFHD